MSSEIVLQAKNVTKIYRVPKSDPVHALVDVDVTVERGQTLGLVGESGSGKTTLTRMLLGLEPPTEGEITFEGRELQSLDDEEMRQYRRSVAAVFQNPYSSLNPRMRIWDAISEQHAIERSKSRKGRKAHAEELLEIVGLGAATADRYPHQLSGGQRQRVAIARAIAQNPEVVILDEPLSALDVSVSAQIVNLLLDLQDRLGVTYVFVGHDLRLVRHLCHDVGVMYHGRIVEEGDTQHVLGRPTHPYTDALLAASELASLEVTADDDDTTEQVDDVTVGCAFRPRCPRADDLCATVTPPSIPTSDDQRARCHHPLEPGTGEAGDGFLPLDAIPEPSEPAG